MARTNGDQNADPNLDPNNQSPTSENSGTGAAPENDGASTTQASSQDTDTVGEKASPNELTREQKSTLKVLQGMPKRRILIPFDPLNPTDVVVPIGINGVTYAIPRGKAFDVPEPIADIWEESYAKTQAANQRIKVQVPDEIKITR